MKATTGKNKKRKQSGKGARETVTNIIVLLLFAGVFAWMIASIYKDAGGKEENDDDYLASLPALQDTIAHEKVCMADDVFQANFPTYPVTINNKIYYGCNAMANIELAENNKLRFAIDPVSNKKVDKATAIIVIHPNKDGKVIYFGSKKTYGKYLDAYGK